ncbi:MFS transporter [Arachidicoccus ginsenosidivorans]|uniref:MFS transporter n=1 Tax=Arachidicoccus ginsenosidivorans TaxID=496057 RepID=UPI0021D02D92|nr:MFS transporter [Arachidicoccus ginsenosidivorans]
MAGVTGASFTTASAYIADVSPDATSRAKNFGIIGAAFGLGFVLGPALGALLSHWGIRAPFYAAAVLCLLNCIYGYFFLPESLPKENRRAFDWKRANPFGSLKFLTRHPQIGSLALCFSWFIWAPRPCRVTGTFSRSIAFTGPIKWWAFLWQS